MKQLHAPWRSSYVQDVSESKQESTIENSCVFCTQIKQNDDEKHFVLKRCAHAYVMMNLYPYNAGHLLIIPFNHCPRLDLLPLEARIEIMKLATTCSTIVEDALGAQGVNIGINLGKAAGAGIPAHLHVHVLPRWIGDTNWMPTVADTKVISFDIKEIYQKLKPHFAQ